VCVGLAVLVGCSAVCAGLAVLVGCSAVCVEDWLCWLIVVPCGGLACQRTQLGPFPGETARVMPDAEPV